MADKVEENDVRLRFTDRSGSHDTLLFEVNVGQARFDGSQQGFMSIDEWILSRRDAARLHKWLSKRLAT